MARWPVSLPMPDWHYESLEAGFSLLGQGKVALSYLIPDQPNRRLVIRTDNLSIFDFVLPTQIPRKGEVLTALTDWWLCCQLSVNDHLVQGSGSNDEKNAVIDLAEKYPFIPTERAQVVQTVAIQPYEMIYRQLLGGSVRKEYEKSGIVAGIQLPPGIPKWGRIDPPLFTPSTKAESGHDQNITVEEYLAKTGETGRMAMAMLSDIFVDANIIANAKGIVIADTKFEYGFGKNGQIVLADEVLTPDSSRFMLIKEWELALEDGTEPPTYDKEFARRWGKMVETPFTDSNGKPIIGVNNLDTENEAHLEFVASLTVPEEIVTGTSGRYLDIFTMLTGVTLAEYQAMWMR